MDISETKATNTFGQRLKQLRVENNKTQQEIATELGVTKATISRFETGMHSPQVSHVRHLAEFFNVNSLWLSGVEDAVEELQKPLFTQVPILGRIAAGKPINVEEDILGYESVPTALHIDFALQVHGDSMIGARIYDKDIIFFRKQDMVETGEIAAVQIDKQEYTLKRVYYDQRSIELRADNPMYTPIVYTGTDRKEVCALYNL